MISLAINAGLLDSLISKVINGPSKKTNETKEKASFNPQLVRTIFQEGCSLVNLN